MKKLTEQQKVRRQILFNMPYLLLTFLIKEKVLDSFLDGSSKYAHDNKINLESFYRILRIPDMAIECTLIWRYTKEGHHFWRKLHKKHMGNERFWRIVITIRLLVYLLILLAVVIAIVFVANSI